MPFWRKDTEEEKQAKARDAKQKADQEAAFEALRRGEIPPIARERIMREKAYGKNFFSSDLTSREFLLTKEAGFQAVGQVMGTSFFRIGFWGVFSQYRSSTGELEQVSKALSDARALAVDRMRQEAKLLGASGVIGVRVKMKSHAWSSNITEFTAFGSAIRIPDWPSDEEPFTCALNGQEFWQLYKAGYMPKSVVMGNCAYYIHMDADARKRIYGWFSPNQEVPTFANGYMTAARLAEKRMQVELALLKADGAVGVSIDPGLETIEYELNSTSYTDLFLNYVILGTAVAAHPEKEQKHSAPLLCLDLKNGNYRRLGSSADGDGNYWEMGGANLIDQTDNDDDDD